MVAFTSESYSQVLDRRGSALQNLAMTSNSPMADLREQLAAGAVVLIDGGTGTELERRGVPMRSAAWCSGGALTHPDELRGIHVDYLHAGARVVIANTYASSRHLLERQGVGEQFALLNADPIRLAIEAREQTGMQQTTVVAGSLSTTQQGGEHPPVSVAEVNYRDQVEIMAEAGAELIVLEMMRDIEQTAVALDAALKSGLPVWMGWSAEEFDGELQTVTGGHSFDTAIKSFAGEPVEAMMVMHTEAALTDRCLDIVDAHWTGTTGAYAQTGVWEQPNWRFIDTVTPEEYGEYCNAWVGRGVQIIGGCCGIGPEHIEHLRDHLPEAIPGAAGA